MKNIIITIIIALVAGAVGANIFTPTKTQIATIKEESVFDKIMKSGKIKCGYAYWPTYLEADPNTAELSGIWYDYMTALGKSLSLDVEWVEEVSFADIPESLAKNRFDVFCSGLWQEAARGRRIDFTIPITYQAVIAVVKKGDNRFNYAIEKINDPSVKVSTIDGEMSDVLQKADFPSSSVVGLPSLTDSSQMILNVATGKADVTFTSPETVARYLEGNPDSIQIVKTNSALRLFPEVLAVKKKEHDLRRMLSNATTELLNSGVIEKIVKKYEKYQNSFFRVAKPYEVAE